MIGAEGTEVAAVAEQAFDDTEFEDASRAVRVALMEDLRYGPDATSIATVPADARSAARIVSRAKGVVAGLQLVEMVLDEIVGPGNYSMTTPLPDGSRVGPGDVVAEISAPTVGLLTSERTLLNLVCHLSGVATATREWVDAVAGTGCAVRDTRKTLPGMRLLQKYAVRAGGGVNHRLGLGDAVLVKDNHVVAAGGVRPALDAIRQRFPELPCEVEVDSLEQLDEMLAARVDLVLLDNFPVWQTQMAVQRRDAAAKSSPDGHRTMLESSGGLGLEQAGEYARTGVDYIAVGALTHSVGVLDLGLDM